jgi:hypothetical protein
MTRDPICKLSLNDTACIILAGICSMLTAFVIILIAGWSLAYAQQHAPQPHMVPFDSRIKPTCAPVESVASMVVQLPGAGNFRQVPDENVAGVAAIFNAMPPETDNRWDLAYLADTKEGGILMVGYDGKICSMARLDGKDWQAILVAATGHGA